MEPIIRKARREDCGDIAELFLIASDGLAAYIWSQMDMPGLSLAEIGARRYAREDVAFSYENCIVVEKNGAVIGMAHSFPMEPRGDEHEDEDETPDPVLEPYAELEDPGSLYVSGLALYSEHRGQGIGTRLFDTVALWAARATRLPRVSLICFAGNERAMRLYGRLGFREVARRPIVPHPSLHYTAGDALLLVRPLD